MIIFISLYIFVIIKYFRLNFDTTSLLTLENGSQRWASYLAKALLVGAHSNRNVIYKQGCINSVCTITKVMVPTFQQYYQSSTLYTLHYRCACSFGFMDSATSTSAAGMECVEKCHSQSCSYYEQCSVGTPDQPQVVCTCPTGYSGSECSVKPSPLSKEVVIGLSVMVVLAALTGLALCAYSGYRLFCRRTSASDTESNVSRSISDYKPKSLPYDYSQFNDLASFSRGSAINRGYENTITEESEPDSVSVANDGLRFGVRRLQARLDADDAVHDPTPFLTPVGRTERHAYSEVESQPDYF